jgi:hypothetical protein
MNQPPDDPFGGMRTDRADWQGRSVPKKVLARRVVAGFVLVVGAIVIGVGVLISGYMKVRLIGYVSIAAGTGLFSLAYAVYDGRLFQSRSGRETQSGEPGADALGELAGDE